MATRVATRPSTPAAKVCSGMSTTATPARLLRLDEVGERLNVSRATVYRMVADGRLPAVRLGGPGAPLRVDEAEFEAWLYGDTEAA